MTGAIVITWGHSVPGREAKALEAFGKALEYYEALAKQGRIHGHKEYFTVVGDVGRSGGFMVVDGQLEELLKIQGEPESIRLQMEASAIVEGFTVRVCAGGSDRSVQEVMTTWMEVQQEYGYM